MLAPWKKSYDQSRQHIKKQTLLWQQGPSSQSYDFSTSHAWMRELDHQEVWEPRNWCFRIVVLEKTVESALDCKEIQPVHSEGDQFLIFIGRIDAEAPTFWPLDAKNWLIGKDPDAGKDWRQEEKGQQRRRWLDVIANSTDLSLSKLREMVKDRDAWRAAVHGVVKSWTWLGIEQRQRTIFNIL